MTRTEIDTVPGTILDVSPQSILYREGTVEASVLKVKNRLTDQVTTVPSVSPPRIGSGYLTSHGAIFVGARDTYPYAELYEWRDGSILDLGGVNSGSSLKVEGEYAIWANQPNLYRRDLGTGTTVTVSTGAGNVDNDVAANGDVVYWVYPAYHIFRYRNGVTQQLTTDSTTWQTYPLTDGTNVVYRKHSFCCGSETGSVAVYTSTGEVSLDSFRNAWPNPRLDYAAGGGWVAFTRVAPVGGFQVWTRDPAGGVHQASPDGLLARIVALNPQGAVVFTGGGRFHLTQPGSEPVDFGPSSSSGLRGWGDFLVWQDGHWLETVGGSLFRVDASPPPAANLSVTMSDAPDPVLQGQTLTYTVRVANAGPGNATGVVLRDALPEGLELTSATSTQGPCILKTGNVLECNLGVMASFATASVEIKTVPHGTGTISNTAVVLGNEFDDTPANNRATEQTAIDRPPDCSAVTTDPRLISVADGELRLVTLNGATDPDEDPVTLRVDTVTQDEPVTGRSDKTSPDARRASGTSGVYLRAEVSRQGDGRVYRIGFSGSDGRGGSCSGQTPIAIAPDSSPPSYNSFGP